MSDDNKSTEDLLKALTGGRAFQTAAGDRMNATATAQKDQGGYDVLTGILNQILGWGTMGAGALTADPLLWGAGATITPLGYKRMVDGGREYGKGLDTRNDALFVEDRILRSKGQGFKSPYLSGGRDKR